MASIGYSWRIKIRQKLILLVILTIRSYPIAMIVAGYFQRFRLQTFIGIHSLPTCEQGRESRRLV
jgi:hypothetical protein